MDTHASSPLCEKPIARSFKKLGSAAGRFVGLGETDTFMVRLQAWRQGQAFLIGVFGAASLCLNLFH